MLTPGSAPDIISTGPATLAVLNIGMRPTLAKPEPSLQVEAHLLDYDGELYGKQLRVEFVDRLREEKRFDSVKELTAQISRDIERAQTLF